MIDPHDQTVPETASVLPDSELAEENHAHVLENVLGPVAAEPCQAARVDGIVIGTLIGFDDAARPLVRAGVAAWDGPVPARSMVALGPAAVGRQLALMCENGDPLRPVVLGLIQSDTGPATAPPQAEIDGERLILTAEKEVVLRCGEASITLTRAGKVVIKGTYLLSRSSGLNKIKGGSIELN